MTTPSPVSEFDQKRFIREIVDTAGAEGISESDLRAAWERFVQMNIDAAAVGMWHRGELRFGWSNGAMTFGLAGNARTL